MTPRELFDATNAERKSHGLPELEMDEALMESASAWAFHMYDTKRMRHDMSGGFAENIAWNQDSVESVISTWMHSPGHRRNILGSGYTKLGVGFCGDFTDGNWNNVYWVQRFK